MRYYICTMPHYKILSYWRSMIWVLSGSQYRLNTDKAGCKALPLSKMFLSFRARQANCLAILGALNTLYYTRRAFSSIKLLRSARVFYWRSHLANMQKFICTASRCRTVLIPGLLSSLMIIVIYDSSPRYVAFIVSAAFAAVTLPRLSFRTDKKFCLVLSLKQRKAYRR